MIPQGTEKDDKAGNVFATGWNLDMSAAPTDGRILNVVGRYKTALYGFPRYAGYRDGKWLEFSKHDPEELVVWAWRDRDGWPEEPRSPDVCGFPSARSELAGIMSTVPGADFLAAVDTVGGE